MSPFSFAGPAIISLLLLVFACSKPLPAIENFDYQQWKSDRNACNNKRAALIASLETQKHKLEALDEMDIVTLLGKPDRNELYKRNQKFFYYYIHPGPECAGALQSDEKKLSIRFNAVGLAKEITIE